MTDILLQQDGDLFVTPSGDIRMTESVRQAVLIHLRWILGEWRLGPGLGFPWFQEVFIKNPNILRLRDLIREEIMKVEGVLSATVTDVHYDRQKRQVSFRFEVATTEERFKEELVLYG